jgi:hypothetical protein
MDRYGYLTGNLIAISAVGLAIYAGMVYERHFNAPEPCISNFSSAIGNHPFARSHQEMIDDTEVSIFHEGTADEIETSRRDIFQTWMDYIPENGGENAFGTIVKGEAYARDNREFYVPLDCYATDLESWGGPTLWRT